MSDLLDFVLFFVALCGAVRCAYDRNMTAAIAYACLVIAVARIVLLKLT